MNRNRRTYYNRKGRKNLKGGDSPPAVPAAKPSTSALPKTGNAAAAAAPAAKTGSAAPVAKPVTRGSPNLNHILTKLYENNYKEYIAINRILNISISLVKSNKIIYRTLYTIILDTFEKAVKKIVNGSESSLENRNKADDQCKGKLSNVGDDSGSKSWNDSCYKKLLVNPSAVVDLLKDSMLFQLATINVDFNKIISSKNQLYKDDIQLSSATKDIMNSIKEHKESNFAMQRLYDVVTRKNSKSELPDRNSLFEILRIFKDINDKYDDSKKLYKKIRTLGSGSNKLQLNIENSKKIANNIKKWLKLYQDVYTKLTALIRRDDTGNQGSSVENLLSIKDESMISVDKLDSLQSRLRYIIGERIDSLKAEDKSPNTLTNIITENSTGNSTETKSRVSGKMIKQLFILFYVFYLSTTAQSLEVYTRGLKLLDIKIPFESNSVGASSGTSSGTSN